MIAGSPIISFAIVTLLLIIIATFRPRTTGHGSSGDDVDLLDY